MNGADHGAGLRSSAFLRKRSGLMTIIRNAMFRILPPQPASLVSPSPHAKGLGTAAFRRYGLVSVSRIRLRMRQSSPWSLKPLFGVSFSWERCNSVPSVLSELMFVRRSDNSRPASLSKVLELGRHAAQQTFGPR